MKYSQTQLLMVTGSKNYNIEFVDDNDDGEVVFSNYNLFIISRFWKIIDYKLII